jgi:hypothetical protein
MAPTLVLERAFGELAGDRRQGIDKTLYDHFHGARAIVAKLRGNEAGLPAHLRGLEARFAEYARQRACFYAQELRRAEAPFWRGRW